MMIGYCGLFSDIIDIFGKYIPENIHTRLLAIANSVEYNDNNITTVHKVHIDSLTYESDVLHIDSDGLTNVAIATLTSQQSESPISVYDSWNKDNNYIESHTRATDMIDRVIGYGHNAILEHHRSTFAMMCSLSAYHQLIRHRLQKISRISLHDLCDPNSFYIYYPDSIMKSPFADRYLDLMTSYKHLLDKLHDGYSSYYLFMAMPNASMIKFIVSSNARNDNWIFRERLCLTAQEEIRTMYKRKFDQLYAMYPELYKYGIPPCITHNKCKEGGMTCGRIDEMRKTFKLPTKII